MPNYLRFADQVKGLQVIELLSANTWLQWACRRCQKEPQPANYNIFKGSVVAMVGGAERACPGLTIFAQHSEQNTLCRPAQISPRINQNIVRCAMI